MAKKAAQDNDDSTDQASANAQGTQQGAGGNKNSMLMYIGIVVVVIIVGLVAYSLFNGGFGQQSLTSKQILSNVSNSSLNQTQSLFVNDLKKSESLSDLFVSYYSSNATKYVPQSGNTTIAISSNQTIDSYKMGGYNRTSLIGVLAFTEQNGVQISKNVTSIYYFNTNRTVTCFNDTTYTAGILSNTSVQCANGDEGQNYLEESPFTAANVSSLSLLALNNSVSYTGVKSIDGRTCDNFIISNATAANLQTNYSVFDLCIDTQYGIPLLYNQTQVSDGVPYSFEFTATAVSTNVSSSDFVIPQSYLNTISSI